MQIKLEQLTAGLSKQLLPVYLISGDEPLQVGEAADDIRKAARQAGYGNREVLAIDDTNHWQELLTEADSLSIFADKKLIDLRLPSAKPGLEGSKTLVSYCRNLPEHTILLITMGKLESTALKAQWYQAIDAVGGTVRVWPLQGQDLLNWLQRRAERRGMHFETEALRILAGRIEGNLLAAAQEIEKLYIQHGEQRITKAIIEADVADSARFDVFKLSDALLAGSLNRVTKILHGLQAEAVAAPVVLWALSREARLLLNLHTELKSSAHPETVFKKLQVWDMRKSAVQAALARLKMADVQYILQNCTLADQQIKGQLAGDSWEKLFEICVLFCQPALPRLRA
ncbi:DNA polymerase III subunit delta [Methylomonas paludis]|uniref:DNA polymerase III subunit delta n=1 Tax=Methylomonas paludis TaxID=1173101 RepID=A0A975MKY5_9GAMM|nr:DNA polymerase III subunit delta [Methylomonas paludis]QWF69736.1 DNA polymerase III subunit delta [Methylomonas paludis]